MKLATLKDGTRDGRLVVVSRDLTRATDAAHIARTLQAALDDWTQIAPRLKDLAQELEHYAVPDIRLHEHDCAAPLPRAYQWLDASAFLNHVELVRRARGAALADDHLTEPLMYQGGSDGFLAARDPLPLQDEAHGADMEAEVAVILGDVPMGATRQQAADAIKLLVLVNDVTLRHLVQAELAKGFGFVQSKPACAVSPVAVTPDELEQAWDGGRLHLPLRVDLNGEPLGRANAGCDMQFDFPDLIRHAARSRALCAGSILGSGTVSNRGLAGAATRSLAQGGPGYSCLAELRSIETLESGTTATQFLHYGDIVRIEMRDVRGRSIFGAIEQVVVPAAGA